MRSTNTKGSAKAHSKKRTVRRSVAKKKASKVAAKKKVGRKKTPQGYSKSSGGVLVPEKGNTVETPVPPSKIRAGLANSKNELEKLMEDLSDMTDNYTVSEIELAVSFSADGKFLGVGIGGASTIKIRFRPHDEP